MWKEEGWKDLEYFWLRPLRLWDFFPLCGTSGQLLRHGLFLSWNKFGREAFCSFAIILCKASFSSPSRSNIWKRWKQLSCLPLTTCSPLHTHPFPREGHTIPTVPCTASSTLCNLGTQEPLGSIAAVYSKPLEKQASFHFQICLIPLK